MAKKAEVVILGNRYKLTTDRDEEGWLENLAEDFNGRVDKIAVVSRRFNAQEITRQQQEHAADMANLKSSQEAALTELQTSKERQVTALQNELNSKSSQQADALKELQAKYDKLQKDYDELMELLEDA